MAVPEKRYQTRVILWCVTRSRSTVLLRSLGQIPNSFAIQEAFMEDFDVSQALDATKPSSVNQRSLQIAKDLYEGQWPDKSLVLGKEIVSAINGQLHMIPRGYQHVFLIRDPTRSIASFEKVVLNTALKKVAYEFNESKIQLSILKHVMTSLQQQPVILDADDMIANPAGALQCLCEAIGLPYSKQLLEWRQILKKSDIPSNLHMSDKAWASHAEFGWFRGAFESTGFRDPTKTPSDTGYPKPVGPLAKTAVDEAIPYYQKMYNMRLQF